MTYRVHVKTEFMELELREILQSPPGVLLGVSADAEATLATIPVATVYDLALARPFRDAAHVVEAAGDPTSVVARHGAPPTDLILASAKIEAEVARSAFSAALDTAARLPGRVRADASSLEDDGEAVLERGGERVAHRALLEAGDELGEEALDDQAVGLLGRGRPRERR